MTKMVWMAQALVCAVMLATGLAKIVVPKARMANFGATFGVPLGFTISPYLRGVGIYYDSTSLSGRQLFGPYWIPALRVQNVQPVGKAYDVVLALDLNNLFDSQYAMPWGFKNPGFNLFATVGVRLK